MQIFENLNTSLDMFEMERARGERPEFFAVNKEDVEKAAKETTSKRKALLNTIKELF